MKIRNATNTSDQKPTTGHDSWLEYWGDFSGQIVDTCSVSGCERMALVGAHVRKEGDQTMYIVPMCDKHNGKQGEEFEIKNGSILVPADPTGLKPKAFPQK